LRATAASNEADFQQLAAQAQRALVTPNRPLLLGSHTWNF